VAPVKPVTDDYYGTKIVDPYRYMENLKDLEVAGWMKAQNDYTRSVLVAPILKRTRSLCRFEDFGDVECRRLPCGLGWKLSGTSGETAPSPFELLHGTPFLDRVFQPASSVTNLLDEYMTLHLPSEAAIIDAHP
jgi:hypothetical protein